MSTITMVIDEGDRYIRLFADQLKTLNRYGAVVERHSGDEFMAFLCGNSEEELRGILCELRTRSCAVSLKVSDQYELPLRASAGFPGIRARRVI
ncbi:MAG: hypothetical protein V8S58_14440 [Lachnospiraceae bacterium]